MKYTEAAQKTIRDTFPEDHHVSESQAIEVAKVWALLAIEERLRDISDALRRAYPPPQVMR